MKTSLASLAEDCTVFPLFATSLGLSSSFFTRCIVHCVDSSPTPAKDATTTAKPGDEKAPNPADVNEAGVFEDDDFEEFPVDGT